MALGSGLPVSGLVYLKRKSSVRFKILPGFQPGHDLPEKDQKRKESGQAAEASFEGWPGPSPGPSEPRTLRGRKWSCWRERSEFSCCTSSHNGQLMRRPNPSITHPPIDFRFFTYNCLLCFNKRSNEQENVKQSCCSVFCVVNINPTEQFGGLVPWSGGIFAHF